MGYRVSVVVSVW